MCRRTPSAQTVYASRDRDPEAAHAFDEQFEFLRAVLTVHSAAEDGIIFAALRLRRDRRPGHAPCSRTIDSELGNIYDVHRLLVEARFLGAEEPSTEPLSRVRDAACRLHDDLLEHLAYEEEHVIPMVLALVPRDDQAALLAKVVAENPPDLVPLVRCPGWWRRSRRLPCGPGRGLAAAVSRRAVRGDDGLPPRRTPARNVDRATRVFFALQTE